MGDPILGVPIIMFLYSCFAVSGGSGRGGGGGGGGGGYSWTPHVENSSYRCHISMKAINV